VVRGAEPRADGASRDQTTESGWADAETVAKARTDVEEKKREELRAYAEFKQAKELQRPSIEGARPTAAEQAERKRHYDVKARAVTERSIAAVEAQRRLDRVMAQRTATQQPATQQPKNQPASDQGPSPATGDAGKLARHRFGLGPTFEYANGLDRDFQGFKDLPAPKIVAKPEVYRDPFEVQLDKYQARYDSVVGTKPVPAQAVPAQAVPARVEPRVPEVGPSGPVTVPRTNIVGTWVGAGGKVFSFSANGQFNTNYNSTSERPLSGWWRRSGNDFEAEFTTANRMVASYQIRSSYRFTVQGDRMRGEGTVTYIHGGGAPPGVPLTPFELQRR
jgi:hypothetical protein